MNMIKYLLDEHVDPRLQRGLRLHWPDITVMCVGTPGVPPKGTSDPDILIWCEDHGFVLVTNNRSSMPGHLRDHIANGRRGSGIIILQRHSKLGDVISQLATLWIETRPEDHYNMMRFLAFKDR